MAHKYFNQNNYPDTLYPSASSPAATIKTGGCGPTSIGYDRFKFDG